MGINYFPGINSSMNGTCHAEITSCKKLSKMTSKLKMKSLDLYVLKVSKSGKLGISKPCYHCIKYLKKYTSLIGCNLRYVYYSNSNGNIIKERFVELLDSEQVHISRSNR